MVGRDASVMMGAKLEAALFRLNGSEAEPVRSPQTVDLHDQDHWQSVDTTALAAHGQAGVGGLFKAHSLYRIKLNYIR